MGTGMFGVARWFLTSPVGRRNRGKPLRTAATSLRDPTREEHKPSFAGVKMPPDGIHNTYSNTRNTSVFIPPGSTRRAGFTGDAKCAEKRRWEEVAKTRTYYKMGHIDSRFSSVKLEENNGVFFFNFFNLKKKLLLKKIKIFFLNKQKKIS